MTLLVLLAGLLVGFTSPAVPVLDEAGLLSAAERSRVETVLRGFREASGVQMSVVIPSSLEGRDIESFSMEVAERWGLGDKATDQGLLLVIAPRERRMRLEVGYGLEGTLTDAMSRRILDGVLRSYLREGRTADGLIAVVGAVAEVTGSAFRPDTGPPLRRPRRGDRAQVRLPFWVQLLLMVFLLSSTLVMRFARPRGGFHRRHSGWSGGWSGGGGGGGWSSGGGGWSGGGGGFGGGGASSSW